MERFSDPFLCRCAPGAQWWFYPPLCMCIIHRSLLECFSSVWINWPAVGLSPRPLLPDSGLQARSCSLSSSFSFLSFNLLSCAWAHIFLSPGQGLRQFSAGALWELLHLWMCSWCIPMDRLLLSPSTLPPSSPSSSGNTEIDFVSCSFLIYNPWVLY